MPTPRALPSLPSRRRGGPAAAAVAGLALVLSTTPTAGSAPSYPDPGPGDVPRTAAQRADARAAGQVGFERTATYPVFRNVPEGVDPDAETVAEISDVTDDGTTVVYTDAAGQRIGFLDITDPAAPVGDGSIDLTGLGADTDSPTSVAVVGDHVLVVVDTTTDLDAPSGRLDVVALEGRERVASLDLGGQPDSIAVDEASDTAVVAMENQRDEEGTPDGGGEEGDLPQAPPGSIQTIDLSAADPADWTATDVPLVDGTGAPLPVIAEAGLYAPSDPEPEYVDIADGVAAVSLQENNGVVLLDLATREVTGAFSTGEATVPGIDVADDGVIDQTGSITEEREPDAVQWVGDGLLATANEGDLRGGSRGWTVFDAATGDVVWDAGNSFERIAVRYGLHNEARADNKGSEPEGMAFDVYDGVPYVFVGSERSNVVATYDMTDPRTPRLVAVLPTTNGPEGLLPVPDRDLMVVSSETDDAEAGVRATVGVYERGEGPSRFPSIVSGFTGPAPADPPVGWGALSGLTADPDEPETAYAISDSAYTEGRIYTVRTDVSPALITDLDVVTEDGQAPALDLEGIAARPRGGFWLASEGATGPGNQLLRVDDDGVVQERVSLPATIGARLGSRGLEGVTVVGTGDEETLYVALQSPLTGETQARIGRYDVAARSWTWYGYDLEAPAAEGSRVGLSEVVALDDDSLAVIERDDLVGAAADDAPAVKRVYAVDVPAGAGDGSDAVTATLTKRLAADVLPVLQEPRGWTQEKLEGLAVVDGRVLAVTDNDGLDDATGETVLSDLGAARDVFADELATTTVLRPSARRVRAGNTLTLRVVVGPGDVDGPVVLRSGGRVVRRGEVVDQTAIFRLPGQRPGTTTYRAVFQGGDAAPRSASEPVTVTVFRPRG